MQCQQPRRRQLNALARTCMLPNSQTVSSLIPEVGALCEKHRAGPGGVRAACRLSKGVYGYNVSHLCVHRTYGECELGKDGVTVVEHHGLQLEVIVRC